MQPESPINSRKSLIQSAEISSILENAKYGLDKIDERRGQAAQNEVMYNFFIIFE